MSDVVLVLMTHPVAGAEAFACTLVERHLAACVQVLPGVKSVYRWEGQVELSDEVRLEAKTVRGCLPGLLAALSESHPYQVPELIALDVRDGLPAYLDWVRAESRP